jgi:Xaa-Pro aminopeptidase
MTFSLPELARLGKQCRDRFFTLNPKFDAVVTDVPIHIGYLSGYRSILHDIPPYAQALVATRESIALITGASDAGAALEVLEDPAAIWRYGTFFVSNSGDLPSYRDMPPAQAAAAEALTAALTNMPLAPKCVAVDLSRTEFSASVERALPNAEFVQAADTFQRARAVKLAGEIDLLRYASRITDKAIEGVIALICAGSTELEIAAEITRAIVFAGGIPRLVVVTSGERSSRVDAYAIDRRLQEGDLVRMDIGATVNGYHSDMARTYAVGDPGDLARDRYAALFEGERMARGMVRTGVLAGEIFDVAVNGVRSGALPGYQRNHCGHGIGLRSHEFPLIGPRSDTLLESGMVLCVETPYYEIGWGGMMVEDTLIVTDTGHELLTDCSRELCHTI